ncbi:MAG: cobalt-precorrin-6A reductase [Rhodospirillaceae bacterium]|nr:cobalt-precorrin-6A reductase [Rhodospirillaceae bacterium]|tara:strand:- start:1095 stop:1862 length:768 start_codon:yes stop_codon:yes gene_type:complete
MVGRKILLLGGTGDAYDVAEYLLEIPEIDVITSLAGATKTPRRPVGQFRIGGFGGAEGLSLYLKQEKIDFIIDATHPFAAQITRNAGVAARLSEVPIAYLVRRAWNQEKGDVWHPVPSVEAAVAKLCELSESKSENVFLSIGRKEIEKFTELGSLQFIIRSVDKPSVVDNMSNATWIKGRGPFKYKQEYSLLKKSRIAVLVAKNSGGISGAMKLRAARSLKLPVILIQRPAAPDGDVFDNWGELIRFATYKLGLL